MVFLASVLRPVLSLSVLHNPFLYRAVVTSPGSYPNTYFVRWIECQPQTHKRPTAQSGLHIVQLFVDIVSVGSPPVRKRIIQYWAHSLQFQRVQCPEKTERP